MLNKKNIAKAMAAATTMTAAAPIASVVFADVVNNTQEQEIKELKAAVLEKFNTKYTKNEALLKEKGKAGKCVYTIKLNGKYCEKFADFEAEFDKLFSQIKNGEKITVEYESIPFRMLEDGKTVVDFEDEAYVMTYSVTANTKTERVNISDTAITTNLGGIVYGNTADGKAYAKVPVTDGYITVKPGDTKLDLSHPIFKVVDGNYVDSKGNAIKAFDETAVVTDVETVLNKGGVIEGYYRVVGDLTNKSDSGIVAIVKKTASLEKEDVTVADLYEESTDRLTEKGNELRKTLLSTENKSDATDRTKSVKTVYGINKAGEKCELSDANLEQIKVLFEERQNEISEWVPVKEITITAVRNNPLSIVIDHIIENKSMVDGMDLAAGLDRYETSVELSKKGWNTKKQSGVYADTVVLVSGSNDKLVDGLTATPLAAQKDAPVLLTKKDSIPAEVIAEIERLGAKTVYIVGGESAVSKEVEDLLVKKYSKEVIRLAGDSRYETSMKVAEEIKAKKAQFDEIYVVGGKGEVDALSISAVAAANKAPILLTPANDLDKSVEGFLKSNVSDDDEKVDIYVIGGESNVSKKVQSQLVNIPGKDFEVKRLAGDGRQETNAAVIDEFATRLNRVVVGKSNKAALVDSLSAGAYAARTSSHIVLATNELTDSQEDALKKVTLMKGTSNLTQDNSNKSKVQAGYGIAEKVAKFIKGL